MFKNTRVISGLIVFFWLTLIIEFIVLELTNISIMTLLIPILISLSGVTTLLILFISNYYKSKQSVANLKQEYLESLRPKTPLRFCASDDELLKAYKQSATEISSTQGHELTQLSTQTKSPITQENSDDELTM